MTHNKILIVDGNAESRYLLKRLLLSRGHQIMAAQNGEEALRLASLDIPDVIISDIMLPVMNGFKLCCEVKKNPGLRYIPFIFYTATFVEKTDKKLAMSLGASRFVVKPTEGEAFLQIVEEVLKDRQDGIQPVPLEGEDALLEMYENRMTRKLTETVERLQDERKAPTQSERRLKRAEELAHMGHRELDLKTDSLEWSDEIYRILGLKPREIDPSYEAFIAAVHPDDRVHVARAHKESVSKKTPDDIEYRLLLRDRTVKYVHERCQTLYDDHGVPTCSMGTVQDITESKGAEQDAQRESEERYRPLFEEALRESEKKVRRKLDAILSPETDIESLELSDIIDSERVQKLMDEFYRLTNVGIGIIDLHGRVLVGTGWQDICTKFHRVHPESCRLCIESDLELSRNVPVGTFKLYRCKNLMWDIATPIMIGDKHVGNIFLGQFLFDDETPDYEGFRQQAHRYGFNEEEYLTALDRVPRWSRQKVDATMSFYTMFAGMIGNLSYSNIKLASVLEQHKRAEAALRESESRYRIVADNTFNWEFWISPDGQFLYTSPSCERVTGHTADEFAHKPSLLHDIIHSQDKEHYMHHCQRLIGEPMSGEIEFRIVRPDGSVRNIDHVCQPVLDDQGRYLGRRGSNRDITERKRVEELLRDSEGRFRDLYENAPNAYFSVGADGLIRRCNRRAGELLGYEVQDLVGRPASEIYADTKYGKEKAAQVLERFRAGDVIRDEELEMRKADGIPVWISLTVDAVQDPEDRTIASRSMVIDITERKRVESITQARLRLLELANSCSMDELLTATLDEIEALTESTIGFYHFLESDQKTLSLQSWSTNTLKNMCAAEGKGSHYDIARAGVWVDCIHKRGPVIHNDYASLTHRKGMPEGHAPVIREVVVPVFRGERIKAIIGVGNKSSDYAENDVEIVKQLGDLSWDIAERMRAEEALKNAEEKYRSIFENALEGIFQSTPDGHFLSVNPAIVRMLGYDSPQDLIAGVMDIERQLYVNPEDRTRFQQSLKEHGVVKEFVTEEYRKDGSRIWVSLNARAVRGSGGEIQYYEGTVEDISEHKRMEKALQRSERRTTILNRIANIFLKIPDEEMYGKVLAVILEAMESDFGIFGFIGDNGDLFIPSLTRSVWSECQVPEKSIIFPASTWGNSLWGRSIREKRSFSSDGPFHTPEGHIRIDHFLAAPIVFGSETIGLLSVANRKLSYTEEDKDLLEGIAGSLSPILHTRLQRDREEQERKWAEETLRKTNETLRATLEAAPVAIFDLDTEGRVKSLWNAAAEQMLGWGRDEVIGGFLPSVSEDKKDEFARFREWIRSGKRMMGHDVVRWRKDGSLIEYSIYAAPEYDSDGKVVGNIAVLVDITDRKRAEEQIRKLNMELEQRVKDRTASLEAANKELEAFAYSVSHDLRAPLRHIDGFLELLQNRTATTRDEKSQRYMTIISESAKRMGILIDDLLSFSRMGRYEMSRMQVDLGDLVKEAIREVAPESEGWSVCWKIGDLPMVSGDRAMLRIVLANLISNALKFSRQREQADIEIGCQVGEKETVIFIRDNGVGFDMAYVDKLFNVFQRLHHADEFEGTGIGLANVRRIISRHGGRTWAEGEINQGATFYFSLPRSIHGA